MAEEQSKTDNFEQIDKSLKEIQEQIQRLGTAQIALAQGMTNTTIQSTRAVLAGSSKAVFTGLQKGTQCWADLMGAGLDGMNEVTGSLMEGYKTGLRGFNDTLKDVSNILEGKKKSRA